MPISELVDWKSSKGKGGSYEMEMKKRNNASESKKHTEEETRKTIVDRKFWQYLRINFNKELKMLCNEKFRTQKKETKEKSLALKILHILMEW